jgi:Mg-chelatase subunit ChlD
MKKHILRATLALAALTAPLSFAAEPKPQTQTPIIADKQSRPTLEVVFVLDTTSSMGGLIEGAKEKIWSIASRMATGKPTPHIKVGLVGFRDKGDAYVTKRFDLTDDLDAVYKNLKAFQAEGGGDGPEHVGQALGEATRLMSWSQNQKTAKMIFLVGDAPPHDDYNDGFNSLKMAKEAIQKGIVVNTVRCGNQADTEVNFKQIAKLADGSFDSIGQTGGMLAVKTPFDDEIGKLSGAIADTSVFAGSKSVRDEGGKAKAERKMLAPSAAADRVSYLTNSGLGSAGGSTRGAVDLADAPQKLAEIKEEELPEELKKLTANERTQFVAKQAEQRKQLAAQATALSKKRDEWILKNAKTDKDSFDNRVFESVKTNAAKVGVAY